MLCTAYTCSKSSPFFHAFFSTYEGMGLKLDPHTHFSEYIHSPEFMRSPPYIWLRNMAEKYGCVIGQHWPLKRCPKGLFSGTTLRTKKPITTYGIPPPERGRGEGGGGNSQNPTHPL